MGEDKKDALRVAFDSSLKLEFQGSKVTFDAGLLVYWYLDETLGLSAMGKVKEVCLHWVERRFWTS